MISLPESTEEIPSRYLGTFLEKISVYEPIKRMFWVWEVQNSTCEVPADNYVLLSEKYYQITQWTSPNAQRDINPITYIRKLKFVYFEYGGIINI